MISSWVVDYVVVSFLFEGQLLLKKNSIRQDWGEQDNQYRLYGTSIFRGHVVDWDDLLKDATQ